MLIACVAVVCPVYNLSAQTWGWDEFVERLTAGEESEYAAWEPLYEELCELHEHPFNLNAVTKEQLEQLPFLSPVQVENLLAYLYLYGPVQTMGELQLVEGLDFDTRRLLSLFVCVGEAAEERRRTSLKNILRYGRHELTARLDIPLYWRAGDMAYSDSLLRRNPNRQYLGDRYYHSLRYQFRYGDKVSLGFVGEKDAGEPFFNTVNKGYDFYSYYLLIKDMGWLKTLALGNYRLRFGQGLVVNTDFSLGKMAALSSLDNLNRGIRKHSSAAEENYFRGIAAAARWGKFTFTAFYSNRRHDATLKRDFDTREEPFITSLKTDGYHRTPLEISKKHNVTNNLIGSNLTFVHKGLRMGVTAVYNRFNRLLKPGDEPYKLYYARGTAFYAAGVDYAYCHPRFTLTGETAFNQDGGVATLNAFRWKMAADYRLTIVQRYYSKEYNALYASAFAESGSVQNESGCYVGVEATPWRKLSVAGYIDFFRFPYLRYRVSALGSRGIDGVVQAVWTPNGRMSLLLKYRYKSKGKDFVLEEPERKGLDTEVKHRVRLQWRYQPLSTWVLKTTVDYSQVDFITRPQADRGCLVAQSVAFRPRSFPLSFDLFGAYFHTDSYDSRVYAYEPGLLYTFSFPAFYYQGVRGALLLRYDINRTFTLTGKYGIICYFNRETIGSAQQQIFDNKKQDIQLQLRVKF